MNAMMLAAASLIAVAVPVYADVVELKNGQRIEGTLRQATPASVSIDVGGQTMSIEGTRVRAIYFGSAPAAGAGYATDAFVLWEIVKAAYLRRPMVKPVQTFDSEKACESAAARLARTAEEERSRARAVVTGAMTAYRCLPIGAQPSTTP